MKSLNPFKKSSKKTIQKLFIGSILVLWGLAIIDLINNIARQFPFNQNLSAYALMTVLTVVIPLAVFVTLYFSKRNQKLSTENIFNLTVVTVAVSAIQVILIQIANLIVTLPFFVPDVTDGEAMIAYSSVLEMLYFVPLLILIVILACIIKKLRRSSDW